MVAQNCFVLLLKVGTNTDAILPPFPGFSDGQDGQSLSTDPMCSPIGQDAMSMETASALSTQSVLRPHGFIAPRPVAMATDMATSYGGMGQVLL